MSPSSLATAESERAKTSSSTALEKEDKEEGYCSDTTEVTSNTGNTPTNSLSISNLVPTTATTKPAPPATNNKPGRRLTCAECGVSDPGKRCTGCSEVFYCDASCQRAHWLSHKQVCSPRLPRRTKSGDPMDSPAMVVQSPAGKTRPRRKTLPPRERRIGSSSNNNNNSLNETRHRRPPIEAIRNANAVLISARKEPPLVAQIPQRPAAAGSLDEQSIYSKPSVIKVVTDLEEDFEHFQEVDDDDALDNDNNNHFPSGGAASTTSASTTSTGNSNTKFIPLTEERVQVFLRDYYEDFDSIFRLGKSSREVWNTFFGQYFTPDIQWVRSSSNSLTGQELAEHFSKDIVGIRMKLVSINSIQVLTMGLSAVVTFTADQKFVYRGNPNSDRTVITMVLNVVNGREIRIAHEHRCTGLPVPDDVNWD